MLNPLDPDYRIEQFWYGFKISMNNFYSSNNIKPRNIDSWSLYLNKLKHSCEYNSIEKNIRNYISLYAIDIMRHEKTSYHASILKTNIKRWEKISNDYNFILSSKHNKIINLFNIYLSIIETNNDFDISDNIELYLYLDNYDDLIIYAIKNNKPNILSSLSKIYNVIDDIKVLLPNHNIYNNMSFIKICKLSVK